MEENQQSDVQRLIPRLLITYSEAAESISMSRSWLEERIRAGELPVIRLGRCVRIDIEDLKKFVEKNRVVLGPLSV